jgi:hypothetical protein
MIFGYRSTFQIAKVECLYAKCRYTEWRGAIIIPRSRVRVPPAQGKKNGAIFIFEDFSIFWLKKFLLSS